MIYESLTCFKCPQMQDSASAKTLLGIVPSIVGSVDWVSVDIEPVNLSDSGNQNQDYEHTVLAKQDTDDQTLIKHVFKGEAKSI